MDATDEDDGSIDMVVASFSVDKLEDVLISVVNTSEKLGDDIGSSTVGVGSMSALNVSVTAAKTSQLLQQHC